MAEYLEVMKQKKRMCKKYTGGGICQSIDYNICPLRGHDLCCKPIGKLGIDKVQEGEEIIMQWAEENPEPVYPSWAEWLYSQGLMTDVIDGKGGNFLYNLASEPIPADIAQKLGIEPKEG